MGQMSYGHCAGARRSVPRMSITRLGVKPLTAAAVAALVTLANVLPAQAGPSAVVYDALGDSFAAGTGAPEGYPTLIDGRTRIMLDDNVATSGARLASLGAQLTALGPETRLVTLSVGGNDVRWAEVVFLCAVHPDPAACPGVAFETNAAIAAAATAVGQAVGGHLHVGDGTLVFAGEFPDLGDGVGGALDLQPQHLRPDDHALAVAARLIPVPTRLLPQSTGGG